MENSILDWLNELDDCQWDYRYVQNNGGFRLSNFHNGDANRFMEEYFRHSGKGTMPIEKLGVYSPNFPKPDHTCFIFILGVIINYYCFKEKSIFTGESPTGYPQFPFVWFLTCLFHDIATDFERSKLYKGELNNIEELNEKLKLAYKLLEEGIFTNANESLIKVIPQYYEYRIKEEKKDHGIIGGLFLYDNLIKIRKAKGWDKELDKFYSDAAAAIATHNIWFNDNKARKVVKELNEIESISFKDSSLLFLLGLVDTIDPLKTYSCVGDPLYILENILLSFPETGKIEIAVKKGSLLNFACLEGLKKKLKWLDVDVKNNNNGITIKIN
jgi:hypothetical protein